MKLTLLCNPKFLEELKTRVTPGLITLDSPVFANIQLDENFDYSNAKVEDLILKSFLDNENLLLSEKTAYYDYGTAGLADRFEIFSSTQKFSQHSIPLKSSSIDIGLETIDQMTKIPNSPIGKERVKINPNVFNWYISNKPLHESNLLGTDPLILARAFDSDADLQVFYSQFDKYRTQYTPSLIMNLDRSMHNYKENYPRDMEDTEITFYYRMINGEKVYYYDQLSLLNSLTAFMPDIPALRDEYFDYGRYGSIIDWNKVMEVQQSNRHENLMLTNGMVVNKEQESWALLKILNEL